jgi:glycosyltransferase involved in cell wall biosynthesis
MTANVFLVDQIMSLSKLYNVTLIANFKDEPSINVKLPGSITLINIQIKRKVSLYYDLKALMSLIILFYKIDFVLVHSISPKAGLLSIIAGWIVRVPIRIHTFTGQIWANFSGIKLLVFKAFDMLISKLATSILVDSHSQKNFLLLNGIITKKKTSVLGKGSISGVDLNKFNLNNKQDIRKKLHLDDAITVFLYVGRIKRDKGIIELLEAFSNIQNRQPNSELWLVGPDEEGLFLDYEDKKNVKIFGYKSNPEYYMKAANVFCIPSYREGFGNAVIEAAACGLPSIGSDIYGLQDSIINGETGLLVPVGSTKQLEISMEKFMTNNSLIDKMGKTASIRANEHFSQEIATKHIINYYANLISESGNIK